MNIHFKDRIIYLHYRAGTDPSAQHADGKHITCLGAVDRPDMLEPASGQAGAFCRHHIIGT
jgi:hypothetical protein